MPRKKKAAKKATKSRAKKSSKSSSAASKKASEILRNINDDSKCFWVCDGRAIRSLRELPDVLKSMDAGAFKHHVNKERNDFANWIKDVIKDKTLAKSLKKSKPKMISDVKKRVTALQRKLKK